MRRCGTYKFRLKRRFQNMRNAGKSRCKAKYITMNKRCRNSARPGSNYCGTHKNT